MSHPLGSAEVRLLRDLVQAYIDHGDWNEAARADFETAINREQARLEGRQIQERNPEQDRQWLDNVFNQAQLTFQERRAIELAAQGWTARMMQLELRPRQRRRGGSDLSIETIDRYLQRAKAKLRPLVAEPLAQ